MTDRLTFQCQDSVAADVDEIADRTGLPESEVINRLVRLGLQDIDDIDDSVLFGTISGSTDGDPAD
ncbi:Putative antitoxins containing the HTH domain [Halorhabdus sp. SVX81]|uniref:ribbon-helix-helix domain-containing protein n=1 Tax=Halorhabdus sp. SVX81 TaxID=2978283 RepID=UPI0023D9FA56|nr:ribbon-helix-helix domain-containing protein [Halorhabdus sp. SVX81]WEL18808.1 Putative antitoxins containing the HTH domain [Halorhabdus sp. SVX81]